MKTLILLSITSDIGKFLAHQYVGRGWKVIGTYRQAKHLDDLRQLKNCLLIKCDVVNKSDINRLALKLKSQALRWDRIISCVGDLLPAQPFFESDFEQWEASIHVNALGQLRAVHALYAYRHNKTQVVFFAGGGVNKAVTDITAYTASKIMLTKMVEYLDAENKDMTFMIIGPGWTKTKIHDAVLKTKGVAKSKLNQTRYDFKNKPSTSLMDIDACIDFLCSLPKQTVSGRNFSVVFDPWRKNANNLISKLNKDTGLFKLRRRE